jgi:transposase
VPLSSVPTTSAEVVTVGVDTHKDVHVAVALDGLGRRLGTLSVPTSPVGYKELVDWARGFGPLERAGVEGTGSFGSGLARFLEACAPTRATCDPGKARRKTGASCGA